MGKATDKVRAEFADKLAQAEKEDQINSVLAASNIPTPRHTHVYALYGTTASVYYGDKFRQNSSLSPQESLEILRALPPISASTVRDSTLSFQPTKYVFSKENKKQEIKEISCVWFTIVWIQFSQDYISHSPVLMVNWFSEIPDVGIIKVEVCLDNPNRLGNVHVSRNEISGGVRYENTKLSVNDKMRTIRSYKDKQVIVASIPNHILWGRGSNQVPNDITIYYDALIKPDLLLVGESILTALD